MPRIGRVLLPGHIYHLTHRCHNGSFFLRYGMLRSEYRKMLWQAVRRFRIQMLNYCVTSNHTHLMVIARRPAAISVFLRHLDGEFAARYNRRKNRRGAFWSERYHSTAIESGEHFWNCMWYIDRNMVRAGVVRHPSEWSWCGFQEIAGLRRRYRALDLAELVRMGGMIDSRALVQWYCVELDARLQTVSQVREALWTESIAVGSKEFVHRIAGLAKSRKRLEIREGPDSGWHVCDPGPNRVSTDCALEDHALKVRK